MHNFEKFTNSNSNSTPENPTPNNDFSTPDATPKIPSTPENPTSQSTPESDFPPFESPEKVTNYEVIRARELGEVIKNPDVVGLNLDDASIVNPSRLREISYAREQLNNGITLEELSQTFSQHYGMAVTPERLQAAIQEEEAKIPTFASEISRLPDGAKFRVHVNGEASPFTVTECIHTDSTGAKHALFCPEAMQQIDFLRQKTGDSDLTVVMNLWTKETGGNVPHTPEEIEDYTLLCKSFVEQAGFKGGKGLVLELGNETDVNKNTLAGNSHPFDTPVFGDSSSPEEYADFYYQVASQLKSDFPDLKLSLAGTAFYDPSYVKRVVDSVENRQPGLIDIVSFHPYRGSVEEGASELVDNQRVPSNLTFDQQYDTLKQIAEPIGASVTVGEVSFCGEWGVSINTTEQAKNAQKSRDLGTVSYLWPGGQIIKYPN